MSALFKASIVLLFKVHLPLDEQSAEGLYSDVTGHNSFSF